MKVCKNMELRDGMLITGGHFMIREDGTPELNKGTIESFRMAVEAYKTGKERGFRVGLGILINDIGATCGSKGRCSIRKSYSRETFSLPEEYLRVLEEFGLSEKELDIYWEKHMRNRGKKLLVKRIKNTNSVEIFEGDHWLIDKEGIGITLSKKREHDKYGNAACPLIMAAYHLEQEKRGFTSSLNMYYVGEDNKRNIPHYPVIEQGKKVAKEFGSKMAVENTYFTSES